MADAFNYGAAPATGTKLNWSDQAYVVDKAAAGRMKDGTLFGEIHWLTDCADCGCEVKIRTGLMRKWLPKRCTACNGDIDLDKLERKAFTAKAWAKSMEKAKEAKREAKYNTAGSVTTEQLLARPAAIEDIEQRKAFHAWMDEQERIKKELLR